MKVYFVIHLVYLIVLLGILFKHVLYPIILLEWQKRISTELKELYNTKVSQVLPHEEYAVESQEVLKQLREVVVYNHLLPVSVIRTCLAEPIQESVTIRHLYNRIKEEISRPHKTFLFYSPECNVGLFLSLSLPLVFVTLSNLKSLYQ
ncbi:hypothetical protein NEHOM01_0197 [Nematocida homosporus]|uniref:uncharacterized protein n=1 Tax=Nematocida homosporus TaxID=1912981 RepID=UPI00221EE4C3|nr:uncharacterized protein NEHOM01_0197 [Nematocida homosporus]KAI5184522.1 hypothetical protein NEHOM01_0197 [Nematocida homosporus]